MQVNDKIIKQILLERERLVNPPTQSEKASGIGIARFIVVCQKDAKEILKLAKEIISIVNGHSLQNWPLFEEWAVILPSKFVNSCQIELTDKEKAESRKRWEQLPYDEKIKLSQKDDSWSLSSWLSWLEPENREWFWWNAILFEEPLNNTHFIIEVTPLDSPFASGALKWLFKASGALDVISEDDL